jgi:4a-hydroxytetrahydrobiopterin dehydratase
MSREKLSAEEITEKLSEINTWEERDGKIFKRFNFENFAESLDFVNRIGALAEERDHHPDITFGWGYAEIYLTTHDAGGLTQKDFELAEAIEKL